MRRFILTIFFAGLFAGTIGALGVGEGEFTYDESIKRDVVDQLTFHSSIDASDIQVVVSEGEVELAGTVDSLPQKRLAASEALAVNGVVDVTNNIVVSGTTSRPAHTDRFISGLLTFDAALSGTDIEVNQTEDTVVLSGVVESLWKKYRAEELASNVVGIREIVNEIVVVPSERHIDENIAQNLVDTLDRDPMVEVSQIDISVTRGRVHLSGTVATWAARDAAISAARFTAGVVEVDDDLTINRPTSSDSSSESAPESAPESAATPAPQSASDALERLIVTRLTWDDRIDESRITVSLDDGIATLNGSVSSAFESDAAESVVAGFAGVSDVVNDLSIRLEDRYAGDAAVKNQLLTVFLSSPEVAGARLDVESEDGIVTLSGSAESYWQKVRAEQIASEIAGVLEVENHIAVVPTELVEDEQIALQVVSSLERREAVDAEDVDVVVEDRAVTLSGFVPTTYARRQAVHAATFVDGVVDVVDELIVRRR